MLLACLFTSGILLAQSEFILDGTIRDKSNGEPIIGAQIVFLGTEKGTVTDINGRYSTSLVQDLYKVRYTSLGYEAQEHSIDLTANIHLDISLEPSTEWLKQVVVSAGRYEQNIAEVTVSMEVLKPDLLRNRNITTLDQALQEVPGMIIVDDEPQIRSGSGYSFGAGSRVQVLLDGIPQLSGDVGRPTWSNIPMEMVDQVEVIKGASSVLYGSAALSGVVHVRTLYPSDKPVFRFETYGGGYAAPRSESNRYWDTGNIITGQSFMAATQIGHGDLVVGIDLLSDDGHLGQQLDSTGAIIPTLSPYDARHYDAERRARGWAKYRHRNQHVSGLTYGLTVNGQKNSSLNTLLWDNIETGLYGAFEGSATLTRQTITNVNPFLEYRTPSGNSWIYRGNWNSLDNKNDNNQDNFSDMYFNELQGQIDGAHYDMDGLKVIAGVSTSFSKSQSQLYNNNGLASHHESSNIGAYLQTDLALGERLNASAGLRWERFEVDGEAESKPVFRAGLNYRAAEATYLRASYGQGYRFPTIGERFISTAVGAIFIYPNPNLQSETSSNVELGLKQGFILGEFKGFIDLALFHQEFKNYIEFTFGPWAPVPGLDNLFGLGFSSLNTGDATVDGIELSIGARGNLSKKTKLSILAGYTYTKPVSTTPEKVYAFRDLAAAQFDIYEESSYNNTSSDPSNDILKYRMQHIARINADLSISRFNLGFGVRYNSNMQNIDGIFEDLDSPGFLGIEGLRPMPSGVKQWRAEHDQGDYVLDLRLGYKFLDEHRLSLIVDNLANREYSIRPLALESSRRIMLKMTLQF